MMRRLLLFLAMASCNGLADRETLPPEGQIILGVSTDAWLPRGAGEAHEEYEPNVLFERLRVEFFAPGETQPCRDCLRDFGIDSKTVNEGRASVGFVPKKGVSGYRARIRIYHSGPSESYSEPRDRATIESVVDLPMVSEDGITLVHVTLRTDDLGKPVGTFDSPARVENGPAPANLANTWHADLRRGCTAPAADGEACVPGGAYWMGDPSFTVPFEKLVVISPFFIDTREVTVGELRVSGLANQATPKLADPIPTNPDATKSTGHCTYSLMKATTEDIPVNCLTRSLARRYCESLGRRLPTEAEHEFVSGARRDAKFPWGEATPECGDAVFGRDYDTSQPPEWRVCADLGTHVAKPGTGALDRVKLGNGSGAEIVDLAANLGELVEDEYTTIGEPCLLENPSVDPVCRDRSPTRPTGIVLRGGSWNYPGYSNLRAAGRFVGDIEQTTQIGFRCAHDGK